MGRGAVENGRPQRTPSLLIRGHCCIINAVAALRAAIGGEDDRPCGLGGMLAGAEAARLAGTPESA